MTSEVTDDQEKMNNSFNKINSWKHWLAMHRRRLVCAQWSQVLQLWWINGHRISFLSLAFFIGMHWRVKQFQNIWK